MRRAWFAASNWGLVLAGLLLYNALNANPVESYNEAFIAGGAWLTPTGVLSGAGLVLLYETLAMSLLRS